MLLKRPIPQQAGGVRQPLFWKFRAWRDHRAFQARAVRVLAAVTAGDCFVTDICKSADVAIAAVYGILDHLEDTGQLESAWEKLAPFEARRPRRMYFPAGLKP